MTYRCPRVRVECDVNSEHWTDIKRSWPVLHPSTCCIADGGQLLNIATWVNCRELQTNAQHMDNVFKHKAIAVLNPLTILELDVDQKKWRTKYAEGKSFYLSCGYG